MTNPFSGAITKEGSPSSKKLVTINGVFYKSANQSTKPTELKSNTLYIRGEPFLVTGNGNCLQRARDSTTRSVEIGKRIDIGGCTFVANEKGSFERTNSHVVRSYIR